MKYFIALFCLVSLSTFGQQRFKQNVQKIPTQTLPSAYIGLGTGLNNYSGLIGVELEAPLLPRFSITGTVGLGLWGFKAGGGIMYYLKRPQFGSALSIGYAHAFGVSGVEFEAENGGRTMTFEGAGTVNLMYAYHFHLGRQSKFSLGVGWAVPTVAEPYRTTSPQNAPPLTDLDRQALSLVQPGGLLLSIKFLFAVD